MAASTPGLELLFCSVQQQLQSQHDAVICAIHWNMITNGFKCIGNGEVTAIAGIKLSENLPRRWNSEQGVYVLSYVSQDGNVTYILKVLKVDDVLLVHLWRDQEEKVVTMNIRVEDYATSDQSSFETALKEMEDLKKRFKSEILDELKKGEKAKVETSQGQRSQPRSRLEDDDPLRERPRHSQRPPPPEWADPGDPFSIGRGDLDPLGRGMGGMYFDPMRSGGPGIRPDPSAGLPGRLPRGAVPPGARFDPFGPPGTRPGPDPDHLPPPGYDDMFM